jgi:GNAT superfamily N-acetyltransferase
MEQARLLRVAHRRLVATLRHLQRHARYAARSASEDRDGLLFVAGANPHLHPYVNAAIRTERTGDPNEMLRRAARFFGERERRFVLWIARDDDLDLEAAAIDAGFVRRAPFEGVAEMALHTRPTPADLRPTIEVQRVADANDAALFQFLVAGAYAPAVPEQVSLNIFADCDVLLTPGAAAFVARLDGEPVAASMVLFDSDVAEVGFVATKASARGRGLGTLITATAARHGFDHGAPLVVLQASAMGEPVYRRMGFVELMRYRRYDSPGA